MTTNNDFVPGFDDEKEDSLNFILRPLPTVEKGMLVILTGYVDTYNSAFFQNQVQKLISRGFYNLIFECSNLTGLASTGFGILTALLKKVHIMDGDIVLASLQPQISETISLLGFAHFFKIVGSLEEAMQLFGSQVSPNLQTTSGTFPIVLNCPSCQRQLKAQKAGRFRCINCKSIIAISESGNITLE